jgi:hypothetical protein
MAEFYYHGDEPLQHGCAMMIAAHGEHGQEEVAKVIGTSHQSVGQVERKALHHPRLREMATTSVTRQAMALRDRVVATLRRRGERTLPELTKLCHASDGAIRAILDDMEADGDVVNAKGGVTQPRVWTMTPAGLRRNGVDVEATEL